MSIPFNHGESMLKRIVLKNFKFNLKNYLLFFLSNTLAVSLFFVFSGLKK